MTLVLPEEQAKWYDVPHMEWITFYRFISKWVPIESQLFQAIVIFLVYMPNVFSNTLIDNNTISLVNNI